MLFDEFFPPPGVQADQQPPGRIVARSNTFADFRCRRNKARALSLRTPTKDNRQFPAAILQSLIAAVYM
jgi:hypothetical protein